uniref:Transthyretin-like family protein n=1 Tax=Strongyloides papillosus TaxID=174720 RepID=A0A0N5BLH1_STREA
MIAKIILLLSLIFTLNIIVAGIWRKNHAVIITGQLLCQGSEGSHVDVNLYAKTKFRCTHLLMRTNSDINGYFESSGHRKVWFGICKYLELIIINKLDFYLKLIHHCLERSLLCRYEAILKIPRSFIFKNLDKRRSFTLGTIELSTIQNQKRICTRAPSRRRRS